MKGSKYLIQLIKSDKFGQATKIIGSKKCPNLNFQNKYGNTALHWAVNRDNPGIVFLLLLKGSNPNIRNFFGQIPLMGAVNKDRSIPRMLIEANSSITMCDKAGNPATSYYFGTSISKWLFNLLKEKKQIGNQIKPNPKFK